MADIDSEVDETASPTWYVRESPGSKILGTVIAETEDEAQRQAVHKFGASWFLIGGAYVVERRL